MFTSDDDTLRFFLVITGAIANFSHDIPLNELDGQHAKSTECPCEPDIERVGRTWAIVYHQRLEADDGA